MTRELGNVAASSTVGFLFGTYAADGSSVAPSSAFEAADVRIYKDGSATQRASEAGYTMTSPFDSLVGIHHVSIDLSDNTDAGFYAEGSTYEVVLAPDETIDSLAVNAVLARFTIGATLASIDNLVDDLESRIGTPSDLGSGATVAANLVDIEGQTDDIGAAGAGLTALATQASVDTIDNLLDTEVAAIKTVVDAIQAKTDNLPSDPADQSAVEAAITALLTTQMTEAYAADGVAPTLAQALFQIMQFLMEPNISGTTYTVKKLDGSTTAFTLTLNSASNPTAMSRTT